MARVLRSVFIPCFAFTNIRSVPADYATSMTGCRITKVLNHLDLAAAVPFAVTDGKARLERVRCYGRSTSTAKTARIKARLWEYGEPASTQSNRELVGGQIEFSNRVQTLDLSPGRITNLDARTKHYTLEVEWRVRAATDWSTFEGCRVDWSVPGG